MGIHEVGIGHLQQYISSLSVVLGKLEPKDGPDNKGLQTCKCSKSLSQQSRSKDAVDEGQKSLCTLTMLGQRTVKETGDKWEEIQGRKWCGGCEEIDAHTQVILKTPFPWASL